jgi:hypothetical protein
MAVSLSITIAVLWSFAVALFLAKYRGLLLSAWREPCLKRPILIFESDDWGAGPDYQADALRDLQDLELRYQDRDGRHPITTLAIVLGCVDKVATGDEFRRATLKDHAFAHLLSVIQAGTESGVFAPQLHGLEHYWPEVLFRVGSDNPEVAQWLYSAPNVGTERLPSHLQSRWIYASELPSKDLETGEIERAAGEEVALFREIFGVAPEVVVPPTFVWDGRVEKAWRAAGLKVLITPGWQYTARDGDGKPVTNGVSFYNGQRSEAGLTCLVRDDYFEPEKGHTAERAVGALRRKTALARPTLLEMHRSNFEVPAMRRKTLAEVGMVLERALGEFTDLAFISPRQLAQFMEVSHPQWVERKLGPRLHIFSLRAEALPGARKGLWATGLIIVLRLVRVLTSRPVVSA